MPKSKRAPKLHLSVTSKKQRDSKVKIVQGECVGVACLCVFKVLCLVTASPLSLLLRDCVSNALPQLQTHANSCDQFSLPTITPIDVRDALDKYASVFLFSFEDMRSNKFKEVRRVFRDSKIFMGKNKLLQLAMGRTAEDEYADNLREVSKLCKGSVGLLMTDRDCASVRTFFEGFTSQDFARAGTNASKTVNVSQSDFEAYPVSMVEQFRKLGLPVHVENGKVALADKDTFTLCKKGKELSAEQCKLLVHFGHKLATFRVTLICQWEDGRFEALSS